jgi:hypothetical protein
MASGGDGETGVPTVRIIRRTWILPAYAHNLVAGRSLILLHNMQRTASAERDDTDDFNGLISRFLINFAAAECILEMDVCGAQPLQRSKLHDITHDKIDLRTSTMLWRRISMILQCIQRMQRTERRARPSMIPDLRSLHTSSPRFARRNRQAPHASASFDHTPRCSIFHYENFQPLSEGSQSLHDKLNSDPPTRCMYPYRWLEKCGLLVLLISVLVTKFEQALQLCS